MQDEVIYKVHYRGMIVLKTELEPEDELIEVLDVPYHFHPEEYIEMLEHEVDLGEMCEQHSNF